MLLVNNAANNTERFNCGKEAYNSMIMLHRGR